MAWWFLILLTAFVYFTKFLKSYKKAWLPFCFRETVEVKTQNWNILGLQRLTFGAPPSFLQVLAIGIMLWEKYVIGYYGTELCRLCFFGYHLYCFPISVNSLFNPPKQPIGSQRSQWRRRNYRVADSLYCLVLIGNLLNNASTSRNSPLKKWNSVVIISKKAQFICCSSKEESLLWIRSKDFFYFSFPTHV